MFAIIGTSAFDGFASRISACLATGQAAAYMSILSWQRRVSRTSSLTGLDALDNITLWYPVAGL